MRMMKQNRQWRSEISWPMEIMDEIQQRFPFLSLRARTISRGKECYVYVAKGLEC